MVAHFSIEGHALITGAASGIGKEIGLHFAEAGLKGIVFADINGEAAAKAAEESKSLASNGEYKAFSVEVDVTNAASVQAMVDLAGKELGTIEYLVNSAGVDVAAYLPWGATTEEDYDRVMNVNTKGIFLVTKAVTKIMKNQKIRTLETARHGTRSIGRGVIINIASGVSFVAVLGRVPYVTSKHAVLGLTKAASLEFNRAGIRVNMICPTWVDTPMFEEESRRTPGMKEFVAKVMPQGRPLMTDEIASAVQYLCSPSAAYISGQSIMLDDGISAGPIFG